MKKTITLNNGQVITMKLTDDWSEIKFWENGRQLSGEFEFIEDEDEVRFLLCRMYTPINRQGLGEEALKFFIEVTGGVIWTRTHDGIVRDDGSHLTGQAPSFVGKMQDLGLIEPWDDDY